MTTMEKAKQIFSKEQVERVVELTHRKVEISDETYEAILQNVIDGNREKNGAIIESL